MWSEDQAPQLPLELELPPRSQPRPIVPTGGRRPREVYHINIRISIFGCSVHQANEIASCFSRATVTCSFTWVPHLSSLFSFRQYLLRGFKPSGAVSPLTDIHEPRAMEDERRRRSPEQRARHAERMRVSRRVRANATGPDAVSAQRSFREEKRDRQRRCREHLNADRLNSDRVSSTPPFLPLHQSDALVDFLDRLHRVREDLHECEVCLEKYYSMKMQGTRCDRCYREVLSVFTLHFVY
jgi:hypothetical protein